MDIDFFPPKKLLTGNHKEEEQQLQCQLVHIQHDSSYQVIKAYTTNLYLMNVKFTNALQFLNHYRCCNIIYRYIRNVVVLLISIKCYFQVSCDNLSVKTKAWETNVTTCNYYNLDSKFSFCCSNGNGVSFRISRGVLA